MNASLSQGRDQQDPQALSDRLERGWQMIDGEPDPRRRWRLEDHWLQLLRTYERACDTIAQRYTPQRLEVPA